ncbi:murein biosynthesis integral membrane protein MurJ [Candidatus Leptofilum sp.]|uniref:murein biosynthesis integral membrane protein MurJ n=1 Tax=Candidatus Leptofilum sp. TaxID=3241576 RepID=UPI003B5A1D1A
MSIDENNEEIRPETAISNSRALVMRAAGLVSVAVLLSRIVGLVREIVIKANLGVKTFPSEAYEIAARFPETIFLIIAGGAIGSAFIPTFAAYFEQDDSASGWRLFSNVINLLTVVVTAVSLLSILFAPQLVIWLADEKVAANPELLPLTVRLMRIMLISPIIFGASGVIMGALNARQHFLLPALAPTIYNVGIITGGLLWPSSQPEDVALGFAVGTVVGAAGHFLVQLPGLKQKEARYTAVLSLRDPGVRQVLKLMSPRVLGLSFSEVNKFLIIVLTNPMAIGSLPALNTAFKLIILPQGMIGQALGIAAFPTLSSLAARGEKGEMRQIFADSLRIVLFLGFPFSVVFAILGEPVVALAFERGIFSSEDTQFVSWALLFYAVGLLPLLILEVVARTFYALSDTLTPILAGGIQIVIMWLLSLWFSQTIFPQMGWLPLGGLALGFSLSNVIEVLLLLWLLRRKLGGIQGYSLLNGLWRMGVATLLMAGGMWLVQGWLDDTAVLLRLILVSSVGGLIYVLVCAGLRLEELSRLWQYGRCRLNR